MQGRQCRPFFFAAAQAAAGGLGLRGQGVPPLPQGRQLLAEFGGAAFQPALGLAGAAQRAVRPVKVAAGVPVFPFQAVRFGAGAGTLYLALAAISGHEGFERSMALKSALLTMANIVAAGGFALFGPVDWGAAVALGLGCLVGGNLGPVAQRHLPVPVLRVAIAGAGLGLAAWLLVRG